MPDHIAVEPVEASQAPGPGVAGDPWMTIVGIGEDGWAGLCEEARRAVQSGDVIVGGKRHLALVPQDVKASKDVRTWPSPIFAAIDELAVDDGRRVCILASGDPLLFGIASRFAARLDEAELRIIPHISSFALICARKLWSQPDTRLVSLCGRPLASLRLHLYDQARIVALSAGGNTPAEIAELLRETGFGESEVTIFEHVGGPRERAITSNASQMAADAVFADLNAVAIQCVAGPGASALSRAPGLADQTYASDGQQTKREVRAITLARLAPRPGELLWDIGAGAGSIAIEWMRAAEAARALAIECSLARAQRIRENAERLGVPGLQVVEGRAPEACRKLPTPDAVFIGGGISADGVLDFALSRLRDGGRLVANVVTLEGERAVGDAYTRYGGELTRISIGRAEPVGRLTGWRPAMAVTQWSYEKATSP